MTAADRVYLLDDEDEEEDDDDDDDDDGHSGSNTISVSKGTQISCDLCHHKP